MKKKNIKIKTLTLEILELIKDLGGLLPEPFEMPHSYARRLKLQNKYGISKALGKMEKRGWVKTVKLKRKTRYKLTDLGEIQMVKKRFKNMSMSKSHTGNCSTLIMFDVPEEKRRSRDYIRRTLVKNGFVILQKSVLLSRYKLNENFFEMIRLLKLEKYISVIEGRIIYKY